MKITQYLMAGIFLISGLVAIAQEESAKVDIPLPDDATIFYESTDREPAILVFHTSGSFNQVSSFYTDEFGEPVSSRTMYGRLEMRFEDDGNEIRVIVDDQDDAREVDIMVE